MERKNNLKKIQEECYILVDNIKKLIQEYKLSNNTSFIHDAVSIYINQLTPKLNQLNKLKYEVNKVEFMEDENIYRLIQLKTSLTSLEYNYGIPEIIHYDIGMSNKPTKKKN